MLRLSTSLRIDQEVCLYEEALLLLPCRTLGKVLNASLEP